MKKNYVDLRIKSLWSLIYYFFQTQVELKLINEQDYMSSVVHILLNKLKFVLELLEYYSFSIYNKHPIKFFYHVTNIY